MGTWQFGKSIKTQLTILLFVLTAACIGVVGFLAVRGVITTGGRAEKITSAAAQSRAEQLLSQTTTATATKNGVIFNNIQLNTDNVTTYAANILSNPSISTNGWRFDDHVKRTAGGYYQNSTTEPTSIYFQSYIKLTPQLKHDMELLSFLDYIVPQTAKSVPDAVAFYFLGTQGQTLYYPNLDLGQIVNDYNPTSDDFYTVANPERDPERKVKWSKVYDDPVGHGLLITAAAPLYKQDEFKGMIGMDISLNNIAKNIESYSPIEGSYAFLIDDDGRAIALPSAGYKDILGRAQKKDEFGANLQKATGGFAPVLQKMRSGQQGFSKTTVNNENLYISYAPVAGTNFSLGIVARQSVVLKVVSDLREQVNNSKHQVLYQQILPLTAAILVIIWFVGFVYIRNITQPIIALTEQTRKVMKGNFKQMVTTTSTNEIGKLATAFNTMIGELDKSYRTLRHKVHELATANAKDDAMFKSIGEGVIVTDKEGKVLLMNEVASTLLAVAPSKVIGHILPNATILDTSHRAITGDRLPTNIALKTGKKVQREVEFHRTDGAIFWLSVTASPVIQDGGIIGAIQIIRDITRERQVEHMKTEFISVASHQLRTPLSAIKWFSEMLAHGEAGKLTKDQKECAENIVASAARMNELVNELLNISRLESGRFMVKPEPTDVKELVHTVVADLENQAKARKQKLNVTVDGSLHKVNLDGRLITQVYLNLITNAIKYTPDGGTITVAVTKDDHHIISTVTDTGYGIPKEEQTKVFQKFYRGSNITLKDTDGTGLGMYLVKTIMDSAGGKISFVSEKDKGTTFTFTLPLKGMKSKDGEVAIDNQ